MPKLLAHDAPVTHAIPDDVKKVLAHFSISIESYRRGSARFEFNKNGGLTARAFSVYRTIARSL